MSTYEITRSTMVDAPAERVRSLVDDLRAWQKWSPWEQLDPDMHRTYGPVGRGLGATYEWRGNAKTGAGSMEVIRCDDEHVDVLTRFVKPFKSQSTSYFTITPQGERTRVTWRMVGELNPLLTVVAKVRSMEGFMGPSLEQGLARLKDAAEPKPCSMTLDELRDLEAAVDIQPDDAELLRRAAPLLGEHGMEMVTTWRGILGAQPHLAKYSAHPDGTPNPGYAAASKPRFAQWVRDVCTREHDQAWLDDQYEIGRRHTSDAKNLTDHADSVHTIPMRYVVGFIAPTVQVGREVLATQFSGEELDRIHAAWTRAVVLHVTVWSLAWKDLPDEW